MSTRAAARHARPGPPSQWPVEPAQWLLSGMSRGWHWVWLAEHGDLVSAAAARSLRFVLLAAVFLIMVIGGR